MKVLLFSICIILLTTVLGIAQPNNPPPNPDTVPITGIEYLLLGGSAYGIYRFSKKSNRKKNEA